MNFEELDSLIETSHTETQINWLVTLLRIRYPEQPRFHALEKKIDQFNAQKLESLRIDKEIQERDARKKELEWQQKETEFKQALVTAENELSNVRVELITSQKTVKKQEEKLTKYVEWRREFGRIQIESQSTVQLIEERMTEEIKPRLDTVKRKMEENKKQKFLQCEMEIFMELKDMFNSLS